MNNISDSGQRIIRIELPTVFEMKTVNSYLIKTAEPILIDCGEATDESIRVLTESLSREGVRIRDLKKIIITHAHVDHIGMAGYLAENSDAEIWVNQASFETAVEPHRYFEIRQKFIKQFIEQFFTSDQLHMLFDGYQRFGDIVQKIWIPIPHERIRVFEMQGQIEMGYDNWDVIHAPGHSFMQSCFYNPVSREMFSADMVLHKTPTVVIEPDPDNLFQRMIAMPQLLESYRNIREMDIRICFPGHQESIQNHRKLIENQLARIESRKMECLTHIERGIGNLAQLYPNMYKGKPNIVAFNMLIGYLDLLLIENKIRKKTSNGLTEFESL